MKRHVVYVGSQCARRCAETIENHCLAIAGGRRECRSATAIIGEVEGHGLPTDLCGRGNRLDRVTCVGWVLEL